MLLAQGMKQRVGNAPVVPASYGLSRGGGVLINLLQWLWRRWFRGALRTEEYYRQTHASRSPCAAHTFGKSKLDATLGR